jgi:hypothetical protein
VDWGGVVLVVVILTVAVVGIVAITRIGINLGRRPRKPVHATGHIRAGSAFRPTFVAELPRWDGAEEIRNPRRCLGWLDAGVVKALGRRGGLGHLDHRHRGGWPA